MKVSTYAEVYSPQTHPHSTEHRRPGYPIPTLAELVEEYGGYTFTASIPDREAEWIGRIAEATNDTELAAIIARGYLEGSFEHLRHLDHTVTRVVHGIHATREPGDPPELFPPPDPDFTPPCRHGSR